MSPNARPRIGLLGPLLPFRGGIAQHTTMLHRALCSQADVITISFKRQYPQWLYPGESDKDPGYAQYREPNVYYIVDSLNPLSWIKACRLFMENAPQAVLIPWWTVFWAPCFGFMATYLRNRGIPVIFICHNVIEHESASWKTALTRWVLSRGSRFVLHSSEEADHLRRLCQHAEVAVHPHPVYNQFPPAEGTLPRRAGLEILFFGFVRPYKGLDILIDAMHELKEEDVFLTVAGEWWRDDAALQGRIRTLERKVEVIDRYISEQETAELFGRADVVALPYRSATGTGIIALAYHYGKPVIATSVGSIPEVVLDGVSGRLVAPEDPVAFAQAIREFKGKSPEDMSAGVKEATKRMTWESLADLVLNFTEKNNAHLQKTHS